MKLIGISMMISKTDWHIKKKKNKIMLFNRKGKDKNSKKKQSRYQNKILLYLYVHLLK